MRFLTFILLVLCFSCSEQSQFMIQPELQGYYNSFKKEAADRGVAIVDENLIMTIEEGMLSKYGGNGVTRVTKDQTYIYIDRDWFDKRDSLIEMTIFHELGHAKLNRGHDQGWSLMNPQISGGSGWPICVGGESCRIGLLNELFHKWI